MTERLNITREERFASPRLILLQKDIAATKADADKSLKALFLQDTRYFNSLYSLFKVSHNA